MDIVISNASDKPIYEQIATQIKAAIVAGQLTEGKQLPSIRALASDLQVSVITTKRAYAELEEQGLVESRQGRGVFVAGVDANFLAEEGLRKVEETLSQAIEQAAHLNISPDELHKMLDTLLEEK